MRYRCCIVLIFLFIATKDFSQSALLSTSLITKLDSVRTSGDRTCYFGELYLTATLDADKYISSLEAPMQQLMKRLEENFAFYFFRAVEANDNGIDIPDEWKNYFNSRNDLSPLQLKLIGANAHINGDIWQAMVSGFTLGEIKKMKPVYKEYSRSLKKVFTDLFETATRSNKRLRDLHIVTLGLDKIYGKMMLRKWRNRQLRLAIYNFRDPERFRELKKRIDSKRKKIDRMIIKKLQVRNLN